MINHIFRHLKKKKSSFLKYFYSFINSRIDHQLNKKSSWSVAYENYNLAAVISPVNLCFMAVIYWH